MSGRVIIDAHAYHKLQSDSSDASPRQNLIVAEAAEKLLDPFNIIQDNGDSDTSSEEEIIVTRESSSSGPDNSVGNPTASKMERNENLRPMTDKECILAVPRLKGFDLLSKEWCKNFPLPP